MTNINIKPFAQAVAVNCESAWRSIQAKAILVPEDDRPDYFDQAQDMLAEEMLDINFLPIFADRRYPHNRRSNEQNIINWLKKANAKIAAYAEKTGAGDWQVEIVLTTDFDLGASQLYSGDGTEVEVETEIVNGKLIITKLEDVYDRAMVDMSKSERAFAVGEDVEEEEYQIDIRTVADALEVDLNKLMREAVVKYAVEKAEVLVTEYSDWLMDVSYELISKFEGRGMQTVLTVDCDGEIEHTYLTQNNWFDEPAIYCEHIGGVDDLMTDGEFETDEDGYYTKSAYKEFQTECWPEIYEVNGLRGEWVTKFAQLYIDSVEWV